MPEFTDRSRVAQRMRTHPYEAINALLRHVAQAEIDAFEAFMFPPADAAQRTAELERVSRELQLLGYDEHSELVTAIDAEATLWREARDEPDDPIGESRE